MAKKKMTLSAEEFKKYHKRHYDGADTYQEDEGADARVGTQAGSRYAYEYRVAGDYSEQWTSGITNSSIRSVKLTAGIIAASGNTDPLIVVFYAWGGLTIGDTPEESGYNACGSGEEIGRITVGPGIAQTAEFDVPAAAVEALQEYKIVTIAPADGADIGDGTSVYADISVVSLEIEYADQSAPPVISGLTAAQNAASNSRHSYTDSIELAWNYTQDAGAPQTKIDVQIKANGGEWQDVARGSIAMKHSYTVSPGKFPQPYGVLNIVYIRMRAYASSGAVSDWDEIMLAMVFPTAYDLSPGGGAVVLESDDIILKWKARTEYNGVELGNATIPEQYDIAYSADGGESWNTLRTGFQPEEGADGGFQWAPNKGTFPVGVIRWRVRPRVNGAVLDTWAQETINVRTQASTSSVSCDGKPHPTVSWVSSSQIAYQVRFADYDSGAVYGKATSHRIPYFYADGAYPVQARTQAVDGKWSAWTELEYVTIRNTSPAGSLVLSAQKTNHAVILEWSGTVFSRYILYRNGIPVYIGSETRYTDHGAHGECTYYVRGVVDPNYLQSNSVSVDGSPATDCMYDLTTQKWIPLKYSAAPRSRAYSETANAVYKHYAGRKYPVAYLDGTADRQLNVAYCFKAMADADAVREALGHLVIYKDTRGRRIIGIFGSMAETVERRLVQHTLNIVQVDYNEEKQYEN